MKRLQSRILALILALVCSSSAFAFGDLGSESVALIAWDRLTPKQQAAINAIFKANPEIYSGLSGTDAFTAVAAVWPDRLRKGHKDGGELSVPLAIFSSIKATKSTDGAVDDLHHGFYDKSDKIAKPDDNVLVCIQICMKVLSNPASTAREKGEALAFLVNGVAAVHEPMIGGLKSDKGGNDIDIKGLGSSDSATDLRSVWDSGLFKSTKIKKASEYVSTRLKPLVASMATDALKTLDPKDWLKESHELAMTSGYKDEKGVEIKANAKLSQAYVDRNLPIADKRLAQAGVRLAALLQQALGN